jgi:N-acetylglucosamine transport system permease protein
MKHGQNRFIVGFLVVPLLLYFVFVILPFGSSMIIAFTRWRGVSTNITFTGLANLQKLIGDELFWKALLHNFEVLVPLVLITLTMSLFFAALFARGLRGQRFFRVTFFFPQVLSAAVVAVLFGYVYHPTIGILSSLLGALGFKELSTFPWLGDTATVLPAIIFVAIWQAVGFYMVLFIASMQSIPNEYYEVAKLDGANEWLIFWQVTLPLMRDTLRTAIVFLMIGAMDMFVYISILANETGGPGRAAEVLSSYLYGEAFRRQNFGYATMLAVVLMIIVLALSMIGLRAGSQETLEY